MGRAWKLDWSYGWDSWILKELGWSCALHFCGPVSFVQEEYRRLLAGAFVCAGECLEQHCQNTLGLGWVIILWLGAEMKEVNHFTSLEENTFISPETSSQRLCIALSSSAWHWPKVWRFPTKWLASFPWPWWRKVTCLGGGRIILLGFFGQSDVNPASGGDGPRWLPSYHNSYWQHRKED